MHLLVWHDPTLNATTIIEEDHFGDLRIKGSKYLIKAVFHN